ncbi:MAG: hypothetical protein KDC87_06355 [Planctomycetes bacterium]|nr:hypothetical protein [Planctomycetota bacterium]
MLLRSLLLIGLACAPVSAQNLFTAPPGFQSTEGSTHTTALAGSFYGRYALQDGSLHGPPLNLREMAFRHDPFTFVAEARRFHTVSLRFADCNIAARVATWSQMPVSTPTEVFRAPVSWPAVKQQPQSIPPSFDYRFPFQTNWIYFGQRDLHAELEFVGGLLNNSSTWPTYGAELPLDAATPPLTYATGTETKFGLACRPTAYPAEASIWALTFNSQDSNPQNHDTTFVQLITRNTVSLLDVFALGLGTTTGVPFPGVTCSFNYIDFTKPVRLFLMQHPLVNNTRRLTIFQGPYQPAWANFTLHGQAVFDRTAGRFLTSAVSTQIPAMPPKLPERYLWSATDWLPPNADGPQLTTLIIRFAH